MQPNTSRLPQNALGRARWDDTIGYYWTRGDGRARLDLQHKLQSYLLVLLDRQRPSEIIRVLLDRTTTERDYDRLYDKRAQVSSIERQPCTIR